MKTDHLSIESRIKIGSKLLTINTGVPQGSLISPLLFNIYIHKILLKVNRLDKGHAYADDIVTASKSFDGLLNTINCIVEWSELNNMSLNRKKCGIFSSDLVDD